MIAIIMSLFPFLEAEAQWKYDIPFPAPLDHYPDTVTITFIGDVMMHSRQMEYDYMDFLTELSEITEEADISIANMEFTLAGEPYSGYPSFSAPDGYAGYVANCGVDVFLTANNHILDKGKKGLDRTLRTYESMRDSCDIQYTGCSPDEMSGRRINPLIVAGHGIRFALINFTYGTNHDHSGGWPAVMKMDMEEVGSMIESAKKQDADFIIAVPHWGTEYQLKHSRKQHEWAEWLVGNGVDLIVGSHPHVVQDATHIDGVPVVFSIGNAISNMSAKNTRLGLAVKVGFVSHKDGWKEMLEPELEFIWCTLPGTLKNTYSTIAVKDYLGRRDEWIDPSDFDNMISTIERIKKETGIQYEKISATGSR